MKPRNVAVVLLWMSGALASFTFIALAVRSLARTLSVFEILAWRSGSGLAILLIGAILHPPFRSQFRPGAPVLQLVRNAFHFAGQYGWAYSVTVLPLAAAFALEFTAPIWLAALAVPLLGERLTRGRVAAIALGLVGVLVILRPGLAAIQPASLVMVLSAVAFAATAVGTKALTRTVSTFAILLWMNILQVVPNLLLSDPLFASRIEAGQMLAVATLAICGVTSHLCLTQAYRVGDAIVVMPLDFLRIPLAAIVGWQVFGEPFDPFVILGAAIIIAGLVWNLRQEARADVTASRRPGSAPAS